jgi:hypothetical protein
MTRKYKILSGLFAVLATLCLIAPVGYYTVYAFIAGQVAQKFTLGMLCITALILTAFNAINKAHLRCPIFIILLGVYIALSEITVMLVILAITTILDELVFTPLHKKYKNLYIINREIDKRP